MKACLKRSLAPSSKSATAAILTFASILCVVPEASANLHWLGSQVELDDPSDTSASNSLLGLSRSTTATFALNASLSELGRTDFEGAPKTLDRKDRQCIVYHAVRYLDHVGEVYSPPRVCEEARRQGLRAKLSLDLTNGWDFRLAAHRKKAKELVRKHRPAVLLLSPPCRTFSPLRKLSNFKRPYWQVVEEEAEGNVHMDYSVELAEEQANEGRFFILEQRHRAHPGNNLPCIVSVNDLMLPRLP